MATCENGAAREKRSRTEKHFDKIALQQGPEDRVIFGGFCATIVQQWKKEVGMK